MSPTVVVESDVSRRTVATRCELVLLAPLLHTTPFFYHPIGAMALWADGISTAADDADYQPKLNGAGEPVIPMTPEQKFEFDLQVLLCPAESCKPSHIAAAIPTRIHTDTMMLWRDL